MFFFSIVVFSGLLVAQNINECDSEITLILDAVNYLRQSVRDVLQPTWNISRSVIDKLPLLVLENLNLTIPETVIGCPPNTVPFNRKSCTQGLDFAEDIRGTCEQNGAMFDEVLRSCVKPASVEALTACPDGHRIAIKPGSGPCIRDEIIDSTPTCDPPFVLSTDQSNCLLNTYEAGNVSCREGELTEEGECLVAQQIQKTVRCPANYVPDFRNIDKVVCERNVTYPGKWNALTETPICNEDDSFTISNIEASDFSLVSPSISNVTCQKRLTAAPISITCEEGDFDYLEYMNNGNNPPVVQNPTLGYPVWTCVRIIKTTLVPTCPNNNQEILFDGTDAVLDQFISILSPNTTTPATTVNYTVVDYSKVFNPLTNNNTIPVSDSGLSVPPNISNTNYLETGFNQPIIINQVFQVTTLAPSITTVPPNNGTIIPVPAWFSPSANNIPYLWYGMGNSSARFLQDVQDIYKQMSQSLSTQISEVVSQIFSQNYNTSNNTNVISTAGQISFDAYTPLPFGQKLNNVNETRLLDVDQMIQALNGTNIDWTNLHKRGQIQVLCRTITTAKFYLTCPNNYKLRKDGTCKGFGNSMLSITCPNNFALDQLALSSGRLRGQTPMCHGRLPVVTKYECSPKQPYDLWLSNALPFLTNATIVPPTASPPEPPVDKFSQVFNLIQPPNPVNASVNMTALIQSYPNFQELLITLNDNCVLGHIQLLSSQGNNSFTVNPKLYSSSNELSNTPDISKLPSILYNTPSNNIIEEETNQFFAASIDSDVLYVPVDDNPNNANYDNTTNRQMAEQKFYTTRMQAEIRKRKYNRFKQSEAKPVSKYETKPNIPDSPLLSVFDLDLIYLRALIFNVTDAIIPRTTVPQLFKDEENRRCYIARRTKSLFNPDDTLIKNLFGESFGLTFIDTARRFERSRVSPFLASIPILGPNISAPQ